MRSTALSTMRAYWEALRENGAVPRRAQVDPRGIENALDIAFLAERIAPGIARLRLAGHRIEDLMGMDVRAMPLSALIVPAARPGFALALEQVFARPVVAELALTTPDGAPPPRRTGRMLLLPLVAEDGSVSRLLGGLALSPPPDAMACAPQRLSVVGTDLRALDGRPLAPSPPVSASLAPGLAEAPAPFADAPRSGPQLRLVVRNDD